MRTAPFVAGVVMLLGVAQGARAAGDSPPDGRVIRCESVDGKTRECPVDATGGARLLRQLSQASCVEGRSWGRMRRSIWVTQGCRAEFIAFSRDGYAPRNYGHGGYDAGRDRRVVRCGSDDGRWTHCNADVRGGADLVRQLSRSQCIRGQSWGLDRGGIWVSGGCRAEFRLGGDVAMERPQPQRLRCESNDGRVRTCAADTRADVRLVKQLSRSACIEGRSWGVDPAGVWVSNGCRAEFLVGSEWADGRW